MICYLIPVPFLHLDSPALRGPLGLGNSKNHSSSIIHFTILHSFVSVTNAHGLAEILLNTYILSYDSVKLMNSWFVPCRDTPHFVVWLD